MNIPVVYEDNWLVVLDKPAGLLVIPTPRNEKRTLTSILNEDLERKKASYRLHPCHRLDCGTSGLIIYAKGKSIQKKTMDLFKQKKIRKNYIAFAQGVLPYNQGQIESPIEGRPAITKYKVLKRKNDFSMLEVMPLTGRTNQIRIHLRTISHPIVGEEKYAFRRDFKLRAKRLCLHARDLEFRHPVTGKNMRLSAPLPEYMNKFLENHG